MGFKAIKYLTVSLSLTISISCSGDNEIEHHVPKVGPPSESSRVGFPSYNANESVSIDKLVDAPVSERDDLCKKYCESELSWNSKQFKKSSIHDFYQTPEKINLRCDYSETSSDIGGSERHLGRWIKEQCKKRGAKNCYWSINYGKPYEGRLACVRPVFIQ